MPWRFNPFTGNLDETDIPAFNGEVTLGSAASPSIFFTGDPNTGIYSPGADQVAISTNGTGRLFVDASGNVGLGSSSPSVFGSSSSLVVQKNGTGESAAVNILGSSTGSSLIRFADGTATASERNAGSIIVNHNDGSMAFGLQDAEKLRITSDGKVGLGTSSPSVRLQVQDSIAGGSDGTVATLHNFSDTGADTRYVGLNFRIGSDNGTSAIRAHRTNSGNNYETNLSFWTNPVGATQTPLRAMTIDSYQRVGVGTTDASSLFSSSRNIRLSNTTGKVSYEAVVLDGSNNNRVGLFVDSATGDLGLDTGSSTGVYNGLSFYIEGSKKATIDRSGRLLVGTSSARQAGNAFGPYTPTIQVEGAGGSALQVYTGILNRADNLGAEIVLAKTRGGSAGDSTIVQNNDSLGSFVFAGADGVDIESIGARIEAFVDGTPGANDMPGRLVFSTTADGASSPTERMRIDSSGNVGIGTQSPGSTLDVAGAINLTSNLTFSTTTSPFIAANAAGSVLRFGTGSGGVERARIDDSGRLLVGTSNNPGFSTLPGIVLQGTSTSDPAIGLARNVDASSIVSGNMLGNIAMGSSDGGLGALIKAEGDGTWSSTSDCPGRLVFSTTADGASSPTERMRISQNGRVASFGSITIAHEVRSSLAAGSTDAFVAYLHSATGVGTGGTTSYIVRTNGNVENTNNSYGAISDIKLKENIVDANSQWSDIKALQVRNYNFKEGQTHTQIGLIAQEVELVSPGLVSESPDRDEDGNDLGTVTKSVNYSVLYMKAVKALQEAMERIETLEASNADLLARVSALESA